MKMNMRIRQYMKDNGMIMIHVANRAEIEFRKFSRMMTGKQKISIEEYEKICKALNVSPAYFFREKFLETKNISA